MISEALESVIRYARQKLLTEIAEYKCISDTNFSPSEYAQAWEVYNAR